MAYDTPIPMWSERRAEEDEDGRTYYMAWTMHADTEDEAYDALASIGVEIGESFDAFPSATCKTRTAERMGAANLYKGIAGYRGEGSGSSSPTLRPWFVEILRGSETEACDRDADGNPLVNSAGDPLDGATKEVIRRFIRIIGWEEFYDLPKAIAFEDAINSDGLTIAGYRLEPGQVRLVEYSPTGRTEFKDGHQVPHQVEVFYLYELRGPRFDANGEPVMDEEREVHTGFYHRQLDAGYQGWALRSVPAGDSISGKGKIQVASLDNGQTRYETVASPVRLDGSGSPLGDAFFIFEDNTFINPELVNAATIDDSNAEGVYLLYCRNPVIQMGNLMSVGTPPFRLG